MFTAALFILAKKWKTAQMFNYECINKLWYIYTMECHSEIKGMNY